MSITRVSISNQPFPFPMDRDGHDFHALFQYMFYTCFSSKVEYRAVFRYLYLKGKTGKEIHGELADVYGSSAPSYAQQAKDIGPTWATNGYLYGSYMGNP